MLIPIGEYEALEETAEILSQTAAREETVTLEELRIDLARRRPPG